MCDKSKVAGIGTVALPNKPADSKAGGSGAAAQLEFVLACCITYVKTQKKLFSRFTAICYNIDHRYITPLSYDMIDIQYYP